MFKKMAALVLALAMLPTVGALAEDAESEETDGLIEEATAVQEENSTEITQELSLEEAIEFALTDNPQIEAVDAKIKSAEFSLDVVQITQKDFDKLNRQHPVAVDISNSMETAYLKHGYYPVAAQVSIDLANMEKEQIGAKIAYDVTEKYFNVKLLERLIGIAQSSLDLVNENASVVRKQYELGYVSSLEVQNVEATVISTKSMLDGYIRNLALAQDSFKLAIQKENTDTKFILTEDISLPDMPEYTSEIVSSAIGTRYDMTALKKASELQNTYFDITAFYVPDSTSKYQSAYSDKVSAEYSYTNTTKQIALAIRSEYMAILSAQESIVNAQNALDVKQLEYDSNKIKYEMGVITNIELTKTMTELETCKVDIENANLTYLLAVEKYDYDTSIGL